MVQTPLFKAEAHFRSRDQMQRAPAGRMVQGSLSRSFSGFPAFPCNFRSFIYVTTLHFLLGASPLNGYGLRRAWPRGSSLCPVTVAGPGQRAVTGERSPYTLGLSISHIPLPVTPLSHFFFSFKSRLLLRNQPIGSFSVC